MKISKTFMLLAIGLFLFVGLAKSFEDDNEFADFENFEEPEEPQQKKEAKVADFEAEDDGIEVEDDFDKDEFENFGGVDDQEDERLRASANEPKIDKDFKLTENKVPNFRRDWDSYWVELLFIAGLCVYFVNYTMGKNKNIKIANSWLNVHKSFLEDNFSLVGDDGKKETEIGSSTGLMLKESDSVFTLWCSGRVCVEGMLVELKLIKRQDLLSRTLGLLSPSQKTQDQVVVKAEISKDSMDTFVLAVCSKKSATKMFKELNDLKQYCVSVAKADEKYNLPSSYSLLSEIAETAAILDARLIQILNKYEGIIDSIHISDQYGGAIETEGSQPMKQPDVKKMLIVSFFISEKTEMEEVLPLVKLVIYLIDKLKRFKLSREGKAKADKNRLRVEEEFLKNSHAYRMEAAAQKREEKRKAEKEKIMNESDVEKQIKLEKKMKKKDAKKSMPKMKSMSIHL